MGPAAHASKGLVPTDPPVYNTAGDQQEWRRNIARWVDTIVQAAQKGNDPKYQTVFVTLANHLYDCGLPSEAKSLVDEAQRNGHINYKHDDQLSAVQEIVELLAVEPPMAIVTGLITSFNRVTSCVRRQNEDLSSFVSRFRGIAADHLLHAGVSATSQVGEVLAITLLNNSKLSDETLSNAKLQLLSMAKSKQTTSSEAPSSLSPQAISQIRRAVDEVSKLRDSPSFKPVSGDQPPVLRGKLRFGREKMKEIHDRVRESMNEDGAEEDEDDVVARFLKYPPRPRLNLDDAVVVLRNISFSSSKETVSYTKEDLDTYIGKKFHALYSSSTSGGTPTKPQNRDEPAPHINKKGKKKSKRGSSEKQVRFDTSGGGSSSKNGQGNSREVVCYDCGAPGHVSGSPDCASPSYFTRKLRAEGKYKKDKDDDREDDEIKPVTDFRKGSRPGNPNHH